MKLFTHPKIYTLLFPLSYILLTFPYNVRADIDSYIMNDLSNIEANITNQCEGDSDERLFNSDTAIGQTFTIDDEVSHRLKKIGVRTNGHYLNDAGNIKFFFKLVEYTSDFNENESLECTMGSEPEECLVKKSEKIAIEHTQTPEESSSKWVVMDFESALSESVTLDPNKKYGFLLFYNKVNNSNNNDDTPFEKEKPSTSTPVATSTTVPLFYEITPSNTCADSYPNGENLHFKDGALVENNSDLEFFIESEAIIYSKAVPIKNKPSAPEETEQSVPQEKEPADLNKTKNSYKTSSTIPTQFSVSETLGENFTINSHYDKKLIQIPLKINAPLNHFSNALFQLIINKIDLSSGLHYEQVVSITGRLNEIDTNDNGSILINVSKLKLRLLAGESYAITLSWSGSQPASSVEIQPVVANTLGGDNTPYKLFVDPTYDSPGYTGNGSVDQPYSSWEDAISYANSSASNRNRVKILQRGGTTYETEVGLNIRTCYGLDSRVGINPEFLQHIGFGSYGSAERAKIRKTHDPEINWDSPVFITTCLSAEVENLDITFEYTNFKPYNCDNGTPPPVCEIEAKKEASGISITNVKNIRIENNYVTESPRYGILVSGGGLYNADNNIENSQALIKNNNIIRSCNDGIGSHSLNPGAWIIGNTIDFFANDGIDVLASRGAVIAYNKVSNYIYRFKMPHCRAPTTRYGGGAGIKAGGELPDDLIQLNHNFVAFNTVSHLAGPGIYFRGALENYLVNNHVSTSWPNYSIFGEFDLDISNPQPEDFVPPKHWVCGNTSITCEGCQVEANPDDGPVTVEYEWGLPTGQNSGNYVGDILSYMDGNISLNNRFKILFENTHTSCQYHNDYRLPHGLDNSSQILSGTNASCPLSDPLPNLECFEEFSGRNVDIPEILFLK